MKITIITISYNAEQTIEETIQSVLAQKDKNMEYVIIDGKSADDTMSIVRKYKEKIDKIICEPDLGISDAFNKGIRNAAGDVIGIINADDMLYPGAVETIINHFNADKQLDVLYGDIMVFTEDVKNGYVVKADTDLSKLRYRYLLPHPSVFISKRAYDKYGVYSVNYKNAMDYELVSRMYYKGAAFAYVDTVLASFREGGVSQSSLDRTLSEHRAVAKRNGGSFFEIEGYLAYVYFRRKMTPVLKKMKIENTLRKMVKKI